MSEAAATEGIGWRWCENAETLLLLFEVDGLAFGADDTPRTAGMAIRVGPCKVTPAAEKCAATVAMLEREGISVPGFEGKFRGKPLTFKEYVEKGYASAD